MDVCQALEPQVEATLLVGTLPTPTEAHLRRTRPEGGLGSRHPLRCEEC